MLSCTLLSRFFYSKVSHPFHEIMYGSAIKSGDCPFLRENKTILKVRIVFLGSSKVLGCFSAGKVMIRREWKKAGLFLWQEMGIGLFLWERVRWQWFL